MKLRNRIIWGFLLIAGGVLVALTALDIISIPFAISPWKIILGLFLLCAVVDGLSKLDFAQAFIMLGFEVIVFEEAIGTLLGKTEANWINNWTVLLIAMLIGIGFNLIFRSLHIRRRVKRFKIFNSSNCSFGDRVKYVDAAKMKEEYVLNHFGDYTIYFENADKYKGDATLTVENSFGDITIYVPREWEVAVDISSHFGDIDVSPELCVAYGDDSGKKLTIKGSNNFGDVEIKAK